MKILKYFCVVAFLMTCGVVDMFATDVVILHTNDTHSQIDPTDDDKGGILRRKVLIDSVRSANDNVLLVDAGDRVQGTLYFNLYGGKVECDFTNELGYDFVTIGNHELDNGIESLSSMVENTNAKYISSNYDFTGLELSQKIAPYAIKEYDGKKIAFIALTANPDGLISYECYKGISYKDPLLTANTLAEDLKSRHGADMVIALTHLGYRDEFANIGDSTLAVNSKNIDIIIGGHSHVVVDPNDASCEFTNKVVNAVGDTVLVAQVGKSGVCVGEIKLDLDNLTATSKVYEIDSRYDKNIDNDLEAKIKQYRDGVNQLLTKPIAYVVNELKKDEAPIENFVCDMVYAQATKLYGKEVDLAIVNKGGIRNSIPQGDFSIGAVMALLPFKNSITILEINGQDLLDAFDVMALRDGDCVSAQVDAVYDATTKKCVSVKINGEDVVPSKTYILATIDYLANGGDYMSSLTNGRVLKTGEKVLYDEMIDYLQSQENPQINPSTKKRMRNNN